MRSWLALRWTLEEAVLRRRWRAKRLTNCGSNGNLVRGGGLRDYIAEHQTPLSAWGSTTVPDTKLIFSSTVDPITNHHQTPSSNSHPGLLYQPLSDPPPQLSQPPAPARIKSSTMAPINPSVKPPPSPRPCRRSSLRSLP